MRNRCHILVARTSQGGIYGARRRWADADAFAEVRKTLRQRYPARYLLLGSTGVTMTGWLAVLAAGLFEIAWAFGLKYSDGLTRFWPTLATAFAILASFSLMAFALRSLPFGTLVQVTNLANGRRVVVVINDRGPFIRSRIIDLSAAAAHRLGMVRDGVVPVRIKVVRWAEGPEA